MRYLLIIFVSFAFIFTACKKKKQVITSFQYEYFGSDEGNFVIYDVTQIIHETASDTFNYQLKTLIGDTITDNEGRITNKFWRYTRANDTEEWQVQDLWTCVIDDGRAELVEENQRKIKLVFIPTVNKEWNINAFNPEEEDLAYYRDINDEKSFYGYNFDSTLVVEKEDFFSLVDKRRRYETYAKNIGLVDLYHKDLTIQNFDTLDIQNGTELYYRLNSYGKE